MGFYLFLGIEIVFAGHTEVLVVNIGHMVNVLVLITKTQITSRTGELIEVFLVYMVEECGEFGLWGSYLEILLAFWAFYFLLIRSFYCG